MKTKVKTVLVLPDNPCLTEPMPVIIRTENGDLMRHRLEKLLKDGKVVYVDISLLIELQEELDRRVREVEPWQMELISLKCAEEVEMLCDMQKILAESKEEYRSESADYTQLCLACLELWKRMVREIESLEIVKHYRFRW